jgi:saccharopine dehydrogenase-like NADP-dependent oxidoreductase
MPTKKVVAVVGATGSQGSSIVDVLLQDGTFSVRALTRNPDSEKAKKLKAKGVEVLKFDSNNRDLVSKQQFYGDYSRVEIVLEILVISNII